MVELYVAVAVCVFTFETKVHLVQLICWKWIVLVADAEAMLASRV